jgi:hypothetical protein
LLFAAIKGISSEYFIQTRGAAIAVVTALYEIKSEVFLALQTKQTT